MDLIIKQWPISYGLTFYTVNRDHCNHTHFFRVNVKEAGQHGFGAQFAFRSRVLGVSVWRQNDRWWKASEEKAA